jgi:RHH-type proline utilization regulon transcriptional repressor/proline dehydrogenase/delta 1-pyrroline-5-carboxylate dehydrogenase
MVGAVVGVQPFGGEGLSGTGPKAGGPLYLLRLLARPPADAMVRAVGGSGEIEAVAAVPAALTALQGWAELQGERSLADVCVRFAERTRVGVAVVLAGPTGERNLYMLHPREAVLCLAEGDGDRLVQLAAVLAVGSRALWPAAARQLRSRLPRAVRDRIDLVADWTARDSRFDAVLHHGSAAELLDVARAVAARPGPIVGVEGRRPGETVLPLERLVVERAVSINTAAAGGNATLMTLQ